MHPTAKAIAGIIFTVVILPTVLAMIHVEPWLIVWISFFALVLTLVIGHPRTPIAWRHNAMPITLMIVGTALFLGGAIWYHQIHRKAGPVAVAAPSPGAPNTGPDDVALSSLSDHDLQIYAIAFAGRMRALEATSADESRRLLQENQRRTLTTNQEDRQKAWREGIASVEAQHRARDSTFMTRFAARALAVRNELCSRLGLAIPRKRVDQHSPTYSPALDEGMLAGVNPISDAAAVIEGLAHRLPASAASSASPSATSAAAANAADLGQQPDAKTLAAQVSRADHDQQTHQQPYAAISGEALLGKDLSVNKGDNGETCVHHCGEWDQGIERCLPVESIKRFHEHKVGRRDLPGLNLLQKLTQTASCQV